MRECGNEVLTEVTYLILLAFCTPNHGYGVLRFLDENTDGRVKPGAGTLYGAVNALIKKEWIQLCEQESRKKIYLITEAGRAVLERETETLKQNYRLGIQILGGNADGDHKDISKH